MFLTGKHTIYPLGGKDWCLDEVMVYRGKWDTFVIPAGFVTDLASTPNLISWLVPSADQAYLLAAILHDYLCRVAVPGGMLSMRDADGIFRRVLQEEGVRTVKAHLMWAAVRWGSIMDSSRRNMRDFFKDFPAVLGWTIVGLPIVALGALGVLIGSTLLEVFERVVEWSGKLLR